MRRSGVIRNYLQSHCAGSTIKLLMHQAGATGGLRHSAFSDAARDAGTLWLGLFALGIGFGMLVCSYGFPWWLAPVISGVVFAGSVEFLLIGMLAAASPIGAIALTTFLVNFRHLFYGLSFPLSRVTGRIGKCYSIFALCDEAYALLSARDPETLSSARILWTQAGLHLSWATGALVGGLVGTNLLRNIAGLGFASTALFLVLAIDAFRSRHDIATLLAALTCAGIALVTPREFMLFLAMGLFVTVLAVRHQLSRRKLNE